MAKKSSYLIGGLAVAALSIGALSAAQGIDAATKDRATVQVNRSSKGDRLTQPQTIAQKKPASETAREMIPSTDPNDKRRIMDGCDPMFSPVTVPAMAHIAGRCVG
jgi:hypothetical protein